jgi:hypothetical protein
MSEAQALALRCEQATVPKTKCVAWIYGTQRLTPTPVGGATHAQVQQSLRATLLRQLTHDVHLVGLACTERLVCTASFTWDQGGSYHVRYRLNGIANKPGCWYTTEVDDLTPRTPGQTYVLPGSLPVTRQGSCI